MNENKRLYASEKNGILEKYRWYKIKDWGRYKKFKDLKKTKYMTIGCIADNIDAKFYILIKRNNA